MCKVTGFCSRGARFMRSWQNKPRREVRNVRSHELTESKERPSSLPVFPSIIYLSRCQAIALYPAVISNIWTNVPWYYCQNSFRTGSRLVSMQRWNVFLSVHRLLSFSQHLRSLWHETSAECALDVPSSQDRMRGTLAGSHRKFYSMFWATVGNNIPREITPVTSLLR